MTDTTDPRVTGDCRFVSKPNRGETMKHITAETLADEVWDDEPTAAEVDLMERVLASGWLASVKAEAVAVALERICAGLSESRDLTDCESAHAVRIAGITAYRATEPTEAVTGDYWHGPDRTEPTGGGE